MPENCNLPKNTAFYRNLKENCYKYPPQQPETMRIVTTPQEILLQNCYIGGRLSLLNLICFSVRGPFLPSSSQKSFVFPVSKRSSPLPLQGKNVHIQATNCNQPPVTGLSKLCYINDWNWKSFVCDKREYKIKNSLYSKDTERSPWP